MRLFKSMRTPVILLFATSFILLAVSLYINFNMGYVADRGYLLFAARGILEGKKLYVDVFDIAPPLIIYGYMLPVYLSIKFTLFKDYQWLMLIGFFCVACITGILRQLLAYHPLYEGKRREQNYFCFFMLMVFIEFQRPTYFFDRDYLIFLFTFPYLFLHQPALEGKNVSRSLKLLIGVCAGIGFCIKPYSFAIFLAVQALVIIRQKKIAILYSLPNLIIYGLSIAYAVWILVCTPEYLSIVVPMAMLTYTGGVDTKFQKLAFLGVSLFWFGISFADFRLRYTSPYRGDIRYFILLLPGFVLYALLNGPWGYVWNIVNCMIMFITGIVLLEYIYLKRHYQPQGKEVRQFVFGMRACFINLSVYAGIYLLYVYLFATSCATYDCNSGKKFLKEITEINDGKKLERFGTLHTSFDLWVDLSRETKAKWVTRFAHLWMLPKFWVAGSEFSYKNQWIPEYVAASYAADLNHNKPELVFVSDNNEFLEYEHYINVAAYLSQYATFREAWKHYVFVREVNSPVALLSTFTCHSPFEADNGKKNRQGYYVYKRIE